MRALRSLLRTSVGVEKGRSTEHLLDRVSPAQVDATNREAPIIVRLGSTAEVVRSTAGPQSQSAFERACTTLQVLSGPTYICKSLIDRGKLALKKQSSYPLEVAVDWELKLGTPVCSLQ
jgi:hypothetical protein